MTKHLVITGGTGGLGSCIADAFAGAEWQIDALGSADLDLANGVEVRRYFEGKHVDLLVCSAGMTADAPLQRLSGDAWDRIVEINFTAARRCAAAVLPGMAERGHGHIVFISSRSALHPPIGQAAYATAKAALLGLTTELAAVHGCRNIRVNAILPGFMETPMTRTVSAERRREILGDHALGRFNTPEAVADFIHFLHHRLPHTSGQTFQLDNRA